jgi:hypothetical protein
VGVQVHALIKSVSIDLLTVQASPATTTSQQLS